MYRSRMPPPAIRLEVLPAGYGDSLLVSCPVGDRIWRMLVDTGPDECWPELRKRLAAIPKGPDGKRQIDLAVISHIDHDHIGGAALLFSDKTLDLTFGDVWFNAPSRPATRGVAEGQSLAELLGAGDAELPWNRAFAGQGVVTPAEGGFVEVPCREGEPKITLLSPAPKQLANLFKVWDRELERLRRKEHDKAVAAGTSRGQVELDLKVLAAKVTSVDRAPANGSSIAFLVEHGNASVLLAADAFAGVLVPALGALARHRRQPLGLKVDALKLSHHGSRANVTVDLLKAVQADHYIVSTNGAIFAHPDDEAIARVVVHGGRHPRLWFNYDNERCRRWADAELRARHGFDVTMPKQDGAGIELDLGGYGPPQAAGRRGTR